MILCIRINWMSSNMGETWLWTFRKQTPKIGCETGVGKQRHENNDKRRRKKRKQITKQNSSKIKQNEIAFWPLPNELNSVFLCLAIVSFFLSLTRPLFSLNIDHLCYSIAIKWIVKKSPGLRYCVYQVTHFGWE